MTWISNFNQGNATQRDLLGGKGAFLAEMTQLGLTVPPGFTVTTDACRHVMEHGEVPGSLWVEVEEAIAGLEADTGRTFGGGPVPLLVSVRSGAKFSMPGMMDTVLNLGMNDSVMEAITEWSGDHHLGPDCHRRFLQMYAHVVLGLDEQPFETVLTDLRHRREVDNDSLLTPEDLLEATDRFQKIIAEAGHSVPSDPMLQLRDAITAVFKSWDNPRARKYRQLNSIPDDLGTAANVQMMVFGDLGDDSGTGVCFTRNPATGERLPYGDYLPRAQGEDVVAGIRNTLGLDDLASLNPAAHRELLAVMDRLERHTTDMADIEFTIEKGKLWILQTRSGKRSAAAAVKIAVDMVDEGLIDRATALGRVDPGQLEQLERSCLAVTHHRPLAKGVAASPGAAQGEAIFDADRAVEARHAGRRVVLVRPETTPDDIHGMDAADGIITAQGGKTSHAAVVARGMGKPAVTGAAALMVDLDRRRLVVGDTIIEEGDEITIDGTTGTLYAGMLALVEPHPTPELETLLSWADEIRRLGVRANADTAEDARRARANGAEGIGLARTEHMFLGERLEIVQQIILADGEEPRLEGLTTLRTMQTADFEGLLEAMDGLPVIVRLLDPPLHEFLPSLLELERQKLERERRRETMEDLVELQNKVARWAEVNPMLGLRGVRLGLMVKDLYAMQAEAAISAVRNRVAAGGDPRLELMIPLVSTTEELARMRTMIEDLIARAGLDRPIPVGTMIELPRAALIAGQLAKVADFFSFGTNDLTQMTFGLSRDDAEALFLRDYLEQGILTSDPFQTIDVEGVGRLIKVACEDGRLANPVIGLGVCGEHGGDPASIRFCHEVGLDYVSCSPPRVKVARLAAAQAALHSGTKRDV